MAYGHAERNLALMSQLEAETRELLGSLPELNQEQADWLAEADSSGTQAVGAGAITGVNPSGKRR